VIAGQTLSMMPGSTVDPRRLFPPWLEPCRRCFRARGQEARSM
jgi:hypothetical protein